VSFDQSKGKTQKLLFETVAFLADAFDVLEQQVERPVLVANGPYQFWRYTTPSIDAAIILKLARIVSGLQSTALLFQHGMFQEVGALARMLDEYGDDIVFLGQALLTGDVTPLHTEYLTSFFQEEFEAPDDPLGSEQKRSMVSRKKIHAALTQTPGFALNASDGQNLSRTLSQAMSGYVHAAASHVMDMYTGFPPRFHLAGMSGTPIEGKVQKLVNDQFHRGICTVGYAAIALKNNALASKIIEFRNGFEEQIGTTNWQDPKRHIASLKKPKR
jgi:hypothetical protein